MGLQSLNALFVIFPTLLFKEFDKMFTGFTMHFFTSKKAVELIHIVSDHTISKVSKYDAIEKNC